MHAETDGEVESNTTPKGTVITKQLFYKVSEFQRGEVPFRVGIPNSESAYPKGRYELPLGIFRQGQYGDLEMGQARAMIPIDKPKSAAGISGTGSNS